MPRGVGALLLLALGACGGGAPELESDQDPDLEADQAPRRVVLITLDTLRYDVFAEEDTPMRATRARAEDGLVFERFFSAAPTTQPTHATIFTGLHPWEHGVTRNGQVLDERFVTVAEVLAGAGWHTEAIVASFPVHHKFGFAQGFARYDDEFTFARKPMPEEWAGGETVGEHFYSLAESTTSKALAFLERSEAEREFLWVHYYDPHSPYGDLEDRPLMLHRLRTLARTGDAALDETAARARELYRSDVARLDGELARLLDALAADADEVETHVLVSVDHGESFGEDGAWGHDGRVTDEQVHVPTFLLSPRVEPGRSRSPAGSVDLFATLLGLAGVDPPSTADGRRDGRDLSRASAASGPAGSAESSGGPAAFGLRRYDPSVGDPRFFAVSPETGGALVAGNASVALEGDLAERELAPEDSGAVRSLFASFERKLDEVTATSLDDEETLRTLDALGYGGGE